MYFKDGANEESAEAVKSAIEDEMLSQAYGCFFDVTLGESRVEIYLALGGCNDKELQSQPIQAVLMALNNIPNIEKVLINEDIGFDL